LSQLLGGRVTRCCRRPSRCALSPDVAIRDRSSEDDGIRHGGIVAAGDTGRYIDSELRASRNVKGWIACSKSIGLAVPTAPALCETGLRGGRVASVTPSAPGRLRQHAFTIWPRVSRGSRRMASRGRESQSSGSPGATDGIMHEASKKQTWKHHQSHPPVFSSLAHEK
jgi:hypothetical protein